MKTTKYIFKFLFLFALSVGSLASCSEDAMDNVNKDTNHTKDTDAKFIFTDVITRTAVSVVGGDYNTYLSVAMEHEGGCHNQLFQADQRTSQWNSASTFNNSWASIYETLKDAILVVDKCKDDATTSDAGNAALRGAGEVMVAYNLAVLTDLFGDTPYTEAFDYSKTMTPKIDSQESIYADIMKYVNSAIADLTGKSSLGIGDYDLLYKSDASNWLKFAYGLKARLLMHTIFRSSDKNADYQTILDCCNKSFQTVDEQASFDVYNATNINPLFDFEWSRDAIAVSKSLYNKMKERNDPRMNRIYFNSRNWNHVLPTDEDFNPVPNGSGIEAQSYYTYDCFVFAQTAPTYLISYYEIEYLKAEVILRLGGDEALAKECVKNAIIASFENTEISMDAAMKAPDVVNYGGLYFNEGDENVALTENDAIDYYNSIFSSLTGADLLKETMIQKYLSFYGANGESVESYNDYRRLKALGNDFIKLENPNNSSKFPLRCGYGNSDTQANPNVQAAFGNGQYVYTEPIWWAGGTK